MPAFFALTLADKKTHNMTYATDIYLNTISAINIYKELIDAGDVKMDSDCLAIDGHDIMKYFEIGPSKKVGVVMKIAAEAVDDGKVKNKKEDILHYVFHLFENAKEKSPLI